MATSNDIYQQLQEIQKGMDPLLGKAGEAGQYFRDSVNKAYNYNLPALKNAAALESKAYSLPGELMGKYDQEYGGKTGVGSMARMNSILQNLGSQFGLTNAAWGLADRNQTRMSELAGQMNQSYRDTLDAYRTKWGMLQPMWSQLKSLESARSGGGGGGGFPPPDPFKHLYPKALPYEGEGNPYAPTGNTIPMSFQDPNKLNQSSSVSSQYTSAAPTTNRLDQSWKGTGAPTGGNPILNMDWLKSR